MKNAGIKNFTELSLLTGIEYQKLKDFPSTLSRGKLDFSTIKRLSEFFEIGEEHFIEMGDQEINYEGNLYSGRKGLVYFLKFNNGLIKIGHTSDLKTRINTLEKQYNQKTELIAYVSTDDCLTLERVFHNLFINKWVEEEFFQLDHNDIETIKIFENGEKRLPRFNKKG